MNDPRVCRGGPHPDADLNAVPLPDDIDAESTAGMGCHFMTSFHAMAHPAPISAGEDVVIHGWVARALGGPYRERSWRHVIGVDLMDEKLDRAEELGAVATVNAQDVDDPAKAVRDITDGGADVSADALGIATPAERRNSLRRESTHVQIGLTTSRRTSMMSFETDSSSSQIRSRGHSGSSRRGTAKCWTWWNRANSTRRRWSRTRSTSTRCPTNWPR